MDSEHIQHVPVPDKKEVIKNLILIAVTIGVAYFVTVYIGLDGLQEKVRSAGIWAPLIVLILKITTIVVAPLGGTIIYPIAGALFGTGKGLLIVLLGDAAGSSIAFWISRRFGRGVLRYFTSRSQAPVIEKVVAQLGNRKQFIKARVFFSGFMDLFAYAAGLTTINFWFFLVVHMIVQSLFVILYVLFGDIFVSGNAWFIGLVPLLTSALALLGAWIFKLDLARGN
jgi:uncharacterized membrane protein YdjX (TVP38/TMEM64 family)